MTLKPVAVDSTTLDADFSSFPHVVDKLLLLSVAHTFDIFPQSFADAETQSLTHP